jgi:hypothetical protein
MSLPRPARQKKALRRANLFQSLRAWRDGRAAEGMIGDTILADMRDVICRKSFLKSPRQASMRVAKYNIRQRIFLL